MEKLRMQGVPAATPSSLRTSDSVTTIDLILSRLKARQALEEARYLLNAEAEAIEAAPYRHPDYLRPCTLAPPCTSALSVVIN